MNDVNLDMEEKEYDYYLCLAKIFDEGYPSLSHAHSSTFSTPPCLTDGISEKRDTTPKECAIEDAPFRE
jgi:hypothetical protein